MSSRDFTFRSSIVERFIRDGYVVIKPSRAIDKKVHERVVDSLKGSPCLSNGKAPRKILQSVFEDIETVLRSNEVVIAATGILGEKYVHGPHVVPIVNRGEVETISRHRDATFGREPRRGHAVSDTVVVFYVPQKMQDASGPLAVAPGSHRIVSTDLTRHLDDGNINNSCVEYQQLLRLMPVYCTPGSVILMHHDLVHGRFPWKETAPERWLVKCEFVRLAHRFHNTVRPVWPLSSLSPGQPPESNTSETDVIAKDIVANLILDLDQPCLKQTFEFRDRAEPSSMYYLVDVQSLREWIANGERSHSSNIGAIGILQMDTRSEETSAFLARVVLAVQVWLALMIKEQAPERRDGILSNVIEALKCHMLKIVEDDVGNMDMNDVRVNVVKQLFGFLASVSAEGTLCESECKFVLQSLQNVVSSLVNSTNPMNQQVREKIMSSAIDAIGWVASLHVTISSDVNLESVIKLLATIHDFQHSDPTCATTRYFVWLAVARVACALKHTDRASGHGLLEAWRNAEATLPSMRLGCEICDEANKHTAHESRHLTSCSHRQPTKVKGESCTYEKMTTCLSVEQTTAYLEEPPAPDRLVVVCGPSGVGKTTILNMVLNACYAVCESGVSHTTRRPRTGERDGAAYHFVSQNEFDKLAKGDSFVEYAHNRGNSYGLSWHALGCVDKRICIVDTNPEAAEKIWSMKLSKTMRFVYILPPGNDDATKLKILRERLLSRGSEAGAAFDAKMETAASKLASYNVQEFWEKGIVNSNLLLAVQEFIEFLLSK
mmetsp:Transcript_22755/g.36314  ORF Transcript_22755/g.36314 Transcript_22755/m.36314 type:complete len:776 (-) Transcript_22755:395-2722(-)|eukprot:CAMPEP_0203760028 /NCGR_PEP_ID=MMETSP0098-20131031/13414_1 /ASSEMBLY_ACC=CAM_ASM_000208 /TAXON_ID=96639 /ORGANISM=" , Strain NY0313808BC1" /LENGTH=775 /DNA_ID=CAMNT_0050653443 /DNA_START=417 /DNA_END=2744 /DNA_ORIENTATION=+